MASLFFERCRPPVRRRAQQGRKDQFFAGAMAICVQSHFFKDSFPNRGPIGSQPIYHAQKSCSAVTGRFHHCSARNRFFSEKVSPSPSRHRKKRSRLLCPKGHENFRRARPIDAHASLIGPPDISDKEDPTNTKTSTFWRGKNGLRSLGRKERHHHRRP